MEARVRMFSMDLHVRVSRVIRGHYAKRKSMNVFRRRVKIQEHVRISSTDLHVHARQDMSEHSVKPSPAPLSLVKTVEHV